MVRISASYFTYKWDILGLHLPLIRSPLNPSTSNVRSFLSKRHRCWTLDEPPHLVRRGATQVVLLRGTPTGPGVDKTVQGGGGGGCGRQPSNQNIWAKQQQNPLIMILNDDILIMFSFRGSLSHGLYVILIELGNSSFPKKKQITKNLCHC